MTDQLVLPSTPAEGVRVLALNRPSKRNALSQELITEFLGQLKTASNDDGVRVIVITGSSTFFCGMNSFSLSTVPTGMLVTDQGPHNYTPALEQTQLTKRTLTNSRS